MPNAGDCVSEIKLHRFKKTIISYSINRRRCDANFIDVQHKEKQDGQKKKEITLFNGIVREPTFKKYNKHNPLMFAVRCIK